MKVIYSDIVTDAVRQILGHDYGGDGRAIVIERGNQQQQQWLECPVWLQVYPPLLRSTSTHGVSLLLSTTIIRLCITMYVTHVFVHLVFCAVAALSSTVLLCHHPLAIRNSHLNTFPVCRLPLHKTTSGSSSFVMQMSMGQP